MIAALLLTVAQATPAAGERFSILVDPCASADAGADRDVVVCGRSESIAPRLPSRGDRAPPDHGIPSNPELRATQAMALKAPPCSASLRGCTVGFGPPIVPMVTGAARLLKTAFAKHPDKASRVPIDLSDPPAPASAP